MAANLRKCLIEMGEKIRQKSKVIKSNTNVKIQMPKCLIYIDNKTSKKQIKTGL